MQRERERQKRQRENRGRERERDPEERTKSPTWPVILPEALSLWSFGEQREEGCDTFLEAMPAQPGEPPNVLPI